ncbi:MAG: ABC-F family ATP-binding cassette domain-containing protein [Candidatus Colwellbacteria bacterium]|jgi:ATPase subunit of ABC transporter with duplicated ATPase domains|nr:ATP-binding cassette domain-containing protein [Candidatus Colwellbacteria bacterium]MCK9497275.1 ATP-binding cassette domain-containing protein [Candidatus Colwellbacteria bacterium]MDD3752632.1 ABC-F family ATP-binding cassette domain-containing protein [Candidatus Colwellbacteria bacterium]MDD4818707.1 ABC-F family ATP-binding cassette domain-containing protein [Candidatus Colwellbacteria bacterium]
MPKGDVILRFNDVSYGYGYNKPILNEVSFSVRQGNKITIMGQNGAGKTTIFKLITGELKPDDGSIAINDRMSVATARQVIPREKLDMTVRDFFEEAFEEKIYDIDPRIEKATAAVNLSASLEKKVGDFSGGQQARLLLAFALIQDPDILLLDEPTNNLDKAGIAALKQFLIDYKKTCIVISHDADFLNSFTDGVLYLDAHTQKIEQYTGNYFDVVKEIEARIERERMKNVRLERDIENRKEQMGFFAQKGGHLRDVAAKMRKKVDELESDKVEMRQEDKTIRDFAIPAQEDISGDIIKISSVSIMKNDKSVKKKVNIALKKKDRLLIKGPNGIGKTTLLESLIKKDTKGVEILPETRIGYYRQDFSTLDPEETVYNVLAESMIEGGEEDLRSTAAGFLLAKDIINNKVKSLSEGQKGLVSMARLVFSRPGLLILDEPTNHINFRHIPVIAKAINRYEGALIIVSHYPEFINQINITQTLDLEEL